MVMPGYPPLRMKIAQCCTLVLLAVCSTGALAKGLPGLSVVKSVPVARPNTHLGLSSKINVPHASISGQVFRKQREEAATVKTERSVIKENGCPEGFISFTDSCFSESVLPRSWRKARAICKRVGFGGDLATINSREEYDFIRDKFEYGPNEQLWIGLRKESPRIPYTWASGETVRYLPWSSNYTGIEPTGYVAMSMGVVQFHPKTSRKTTLPFLCETRRVAGTSDAAPAPRGTNQAVGHRDKDSRVALAGVDLHCEEGWTRFEDKCYRAFYDMATFMNASSKCRQEGAELLSLHSPSEGDFVRNKLMKNSPSEDYWIGLSYGENGMHWSDGSPFDYSNWSPGMPVISPQRTLTPPKRTLNPEETKHLEKCFKINSKNILWVNGNSEDEHCYVCTNNGATPSGAAQPVTEVQNSTTPAPTSPGSTRSTTPLSEEWIYIDQDYIHNPVKEVAKLPNYLLNGLPAIGLFNVSGINLTPNADVAKTVLKSDSAVDSEYEDDDDLNSLTIYVVVVVGSLILLVAALFGVTTWRLRHRHSGFPWTPLQTSSQDGGHRLQNVDQALRDPETRDLNQQGGYGALE